MFLGFLVVIRFSFFMFFFLIPRAFFVGSLSPFVHLFLILLLFLILHRLHSFVLPPPFFVSLALSHQFHFSFSFFLPFLTHTPRLPPPDTRSTVSIFHCHRRGNRWSSRSTTFLFFFFLNINYMYLNVD